MAQGPAEVPGEERETKDPQGGEGAISEEIDSRRETAREVEKRGMEKSEDGEDGNGEELAERVSNFCNVRTREKREQAKAYK